MVVSGPGVVFQPRTSCGPADQSSKVRGEQQVLGAARTAPQPPKWCVQAACSMRWSNDSHLTPALLLLFRRLSQPPPCPSPHPARRPCFFFLLLLLCLLSHLSSASASAGAQDEAGERRTPPMVCGTRFTDTASSALLADVVLEGRVRQKISPQENGAAPLVGVRYNVSIQVRKQVWKGRELVNRGKKPRKLLLGTFLFPRVDPADVLSNNNSNNNSVVADRVVDGGGAGVSEEVEGGGGDGGGEGDCVANLTEGATYIFFLRDVGHRKGRYFHISALPVKKNRRVSRIVSKILKANAAKKPVIQRLKGRRSVKAGSSLTLRCKAKAKPNPIFTWFKDGVEVTSRRGLRIKNSKRGSRLKISKTDKTMSGEYTCRAANALGEASKNITIKVTAPELIHVACQKQTYCFNGGTCRYISDLHQKFCQCPKQWAGQRCEILDLYGPGNKDKTREAKLEFERVLIIVGIVIALLVLVVICIASYFLANRRRKRWEARRRVKQRLGPESNLLLDKTDGARLTHFAPSYRPLAQKETQTDFNFHPPANPPKPDLEAPPYLLHTYPNNSGTNLFHQDNSFPFPTRTAADTATTVPPAPFANQKPDRPVSNIESRDLERNGSRSRLKAVSVNDNCTDRPPSWRGVGQVPDSKSMPVIVDSDGDVPEVIEMNKLGSQPPCTTTTTSNPVLNGHDEVDGVSDTPTPASHQPVALPVQGMTPTQDSFEMGFNPLEDGKVFDDSTRLPPGFDCLEPAVLLPRELGMSGPGREEEKGSLPVNGIVEDWESDDEVPDKPLLPLHISEEDLNDNLPIVDSFDSGSSSPPPPPPPEPFAKDPDFSSLSPARFVPAFRPTDLPPVGPDHGQRPGSLSEDDSAGFLPHTLSSTEASSPLTEGTPQGETYAFDPCMDSDPDCFDEQFMHGSPKKGPGCYREAEDQQDYERRLRDVCADQDAIPI